MIKQPSVIARVNVDHGDLLVQFIGDHSFITLPRIGEQIYVKGLHEDYFLEVLSVLHYGKLETERLGSQKLNSEVEVQLTCKRLNLPC
jgi:hypothetical protein